ncbi:MAG: hypothetical protein COA79_15940 [Planctomycetota bacterium]|nr:MAG: hypothetical protein COA79_15940 [Planctomycetota bacterium]
MLKVKCLIVFVFLFNVTILSQEKNNKSFVLKQLFVGHVKEHASAFDFNKKWEIFHDLQTAALYGKWHAAHIGLSKKHGYAFSEPENFSKYLKNSISNKMTSALPREKDSMNIFYGITKIKGVKIKEVSVDVKNLIVDGKNLDFDIDDLYDDFDVAYNPRYHAARYTFSPVYNNVRFQLSFAKPYMGSDYVVKGEVNITYSDKVVIYKSKSLSLELKKGIKINGHNFEIVKIKSKSNKKSREIYVHCPEELDFYEDVDLLFFNSEHLDLRAKKEGYKTIDGIDTIRYVLPIIKKDELIEKIRLGYSEWIDFKQSVKKFESNVSMKVFFKKLRKTKFSFNALNSSKNIEANGVKILILAHEIAPTNKHSLLKLEINKDVKQKDLSFYNKKGNRLKVRNTRSSWSKGKTILTYRFLLNSDGKPINDFIVYLHDWILKSK